LLQLNFVFAEVEKMAKWVQVASPLFKDENVRSHSEARDVVFAGLEEVCSDLSGLGLDLVVFSEGIEAVGIKPEEAESFDAPGPFLGAYMRFAKRERCHVAASVKLIGSAGEVFNSIAFIDSGGRPIGAYHKTFLTQSELDEGLTPGTGAAVIDSKIGRLGGVICFDLNFPEFRSEYAALAPDILCFSSMYHGSHVQQTWAYDCRSFFVAALPFHGGGILDPLGTVLAKTDCYNSVARARINLDRVVLHLDYNRVKFRDIERKYRDGVTITVPPDLAPAILYSNLPDRSAGEIAAEFELELLNDYVARMRQANLSRRKGRQ
jgi:predicted amidohydrolase